ncbi:MAG TPA: helix-turn-helix domain-containing protein [Roseiarcus sp.]|jgi:AcrR family transcriptional regulator
MVSQKSSAPAVEPKRQRGRDRVAAILDAAAVVFTAKGYEGATMTEVAALAGAAIGSLYRFFPTKEALADALVARYGASLVNAFAEIEQKAAELTPPDLADALIEVMQGHEPARSAAIELTDARADAVEVRTTLRGAVRAAIAGIVAKMAPRLPSRDAQAAATLLLHVLKSLRNLPRGEDGADARLALEARALVARYIAGLENEPETA